MKRKGNEANGFQLQEKSNSPREKQHCLEGISCLPWRPHIRGGLRLDSASLPRKTRNLLDGHTGVSLTHKPEPHPVTLLHETKRLRNIHRALKMSDTE